MQVECSVRTNSRVPAMKRILYPTDHCMKQFLKTEFEKHKYVPLSSPALSFSEILMAYPLQFFMCSSKVLLNLADSCCNGLPLNIFPAFTFPPSCHIPLTTRPLACYLEAQTQPSLKVNSCLSFKH